MTRFFVESDLVPGGRRSVTQRTPNGMFTLVVIRGPFTLGDATCQLICDLLNLWATDDSIPVEWERPG